MESVSFEVRRGLLDEGDGARPEVAVEELVTRRGQEVCEHG